MDANQIIVLVVTVAITALITTLVSALTTWLISRPKKRKEEAEAEATERSETKKTLKNINGKLTDIDDSLVKFHELQEKNAEDLQLCKLGIQAETKNSLKLRYEEWIKKGYAPMDAKDDLERMYEVYHKLGANGVMDGLRKRFLALPETKPETHRKK